MGFVKSTPCPVIEVEANCALFNIICQWLAGKFLLKSLAYSNHFSFDMFYSLFLSWRYVSKSMPILPILARALLNFHQYIFCKSSKLPLYEQSFESLLFSPLVRLENNFYLYLLWNLKKCLSLWSIKSFLSFVSWILIISLWCILMAQFYLFLPAILFICRNYIFLSQNLSPFSSSFTAECYAIIEVLSFISNLASNKYLIASDSMSCLQALMSNPFDSHLSLSFNQSS